ncbi:hypothetical protein RB195_013083 [Necator americanus]|uniref:Histone-lysine N-methyltransferase SETMAR n=1 Tax=Necator americanus TaxID=51031 RepID=A0ABR1DUL1_NECAM
MELDLVLLRRQVDADPFQTTRDSRSWDESNHSCSQIEVNQQDNFTTPTVYPRSGSLGLPLFSYLQRHLDGQDFQTRDDIKKALEQFFKEQSPAFWSKGIYDLPKRWQKTIDANEAYFK